MRVISANLNGIRSAASKGFFDWMKRQQADIVCVQEVKAQEADLSPEMHHPGAFHGNFSLAEKKGYAGVGLYCRREPDVVHRGFGSHEHDGEGRYLQADFGRLSVVSLYLPSGSAGPHRQASKFRFLELFTPQLKKLRKSGREVILCGDWNIAHKEIDLKNWRSNQKNSGFLPEERAWLTKVFDELGWVDVFRVLNDKPEQYTWWSHRGQAYAKNVGWRIDYQIATPGIAKKADKEHIYKDRRFSDHAPLIIDYDYKL
ncbi:MAG: exodeoxyribonuclease III [Candidatus Muproteobacteria bacterium RBG_16_64_10]|uniref:Exodeoxyribonuclease III n=1 Tax=Candidatus Muproteobacteria bacterium RBG_16_64_10 TaxID=1817757 RepID=A0A1F6T364_9PROT|nr:MAG: exodeoxyribonuclease III [Candidatus Muproteobacteria bacterium RBG_16_64_10]